jgi:hypothetical protein
MPVHSPDGTPRFADAPKVNMPTSAPARKVVGASAGAGIGGVTAGLILWALGAYVFDGNVPDAVSAFVYVVAPLVLSFVGGYVTKRSTDELMVPAPGGD